MAPQNVEEEHNLELQADLITNIRKNLNKSNSDWKYNPVEGINLVHCRDRIYVPKTLSEHVLKWYHCYLQHPGGDKLSQTLTSICRWMDTETL